MIKSVFIPLLILGLAVTGFIYLRDSRPAQASKPITEKSWQVATLTVQHKAIQPEITLYGRVESPDQTNLTAAITADVHAVHVQEGESVSVGKTLIELDDQETQLIIDQRIAELSEIQSLISSEEARLVRDQKLLTYQNQLLALNKKAVERNKQLEKSALASKSALDTARETVAKQSINIQQLRFEITDHPARINQLKAREKKAEALLAQARLDHSRTQIKAPFPGKITSRTVAKGDRVRPGEALISLYNPNTLEIRAQIPDHAAIVIEKTLRDNQPMMATSDTKDRFKLDRLAAQIQQNSGGIDGLFHPQDKAQKSLVPGQFVNLRLKLPRIEQVISIPFSALYGLDTLYQLTDGRMQALKITRLGEYQQEDQETYLLIESDQLKEGDTIITTQLPNAINGLKVIPSND